MNYRLIAFDLDGTLLDSEKRIPAENIAALRRAAEKGAYIVPATGRILGGIPEELSALPFIRYYVCINGAAVMDAQTGEALYRAEIALDTALRFYEYMDTLPVIYDCYQDGRGWMTRGMYDRAEEFMPDKGILCLIKSLRVPVPELKAHLAAKGETLEKMQVYFNDMELRARMLKELPGRFPELLFSSSVSNNIEVNRGGKGQRPARAVPPSRRGHGADCRLRRRNERHGHAARGGPRRRHGERDGGREKRGGLYHAVE